jgi:hypothetical protein
MVDLVERLSEAASAVIERQRDDIERDGRTLRGLTIELTLGSAKAIDATCYLERRMRIGARSER